MWVEAGNGKLQKNMCAMSEEKDLSSSPSSSCRRKHPRRREEEEEKYHRLFVFKNILFINEH